MSDLTGLSCTTCRVRFEHSGEQRAHYKGDLHRFNLKRKMVRLAPVTEEQFVEHMRLVAAQEQQQRMSSRGNQSRANARNAMESAVSGDSDARAAGAQLPPVSVSTFACRVCRGKTFASRNTFDQHVKSKQHLKRAAAAAKKGPAASPAAETAAAAAAEARGEDAVREEDAQQQQQQQQPAGLAAAAEEQESAAATTTTSVAAPSAAAAPVAAASAATAAAAAAAEAEGADGGSSAPSSSSASAASSEPVVLERGVLEPLVPRAGAGAGRGALREHLHQKKTLGDGGDDDDDDDRMGADDDALAAAPELDEDDIEALIAERIRTAPRLPVEACIFCSHESADVESNFAHMADVHSLFIPDLEYLDDPEGLLRYLSDKVTIGYECLWCHGVGRAFNSLEAVRAHMEAKSHCKLDWFGNEGEYEDFYDYSASYAHLLATTGAAPSAAGTLLEGPKAEAGEDAREGSSDDDDDDDEDALLGVEPAVTDYEPGISLTLRDGRQLGHRSLNRYFKQQFHPTEDREAIVAAKAQQHHQPTNKNGKVLESLSGRYKALGYTGRNAGGGAIAPAVRKEIASRFLRASKAEVRYRNKQSQRLGQHMSNLPKHFRDPTAHLQ